MFKIGFLANYRLFHKGSFAKNPSLARRAAPLLTPTKLKFCQKDSGIKMKEEMRKLNLQN